MAASDRFTRTGALTEVVAVTPDDANDLPGPWARALYVGGAGNVSVLMREGDDTPVLLTALTPGVWHSLAVRRVLATNTTATAILVGR